MTAWGDFRKTADKCGFRHVVWHWCRNRHCPRCQAEARKRWLEERKKELLPVPYFHVVFTVPDLLNAFALAGPRQFYDILFAATRETLLVIGSDPRHLGARIGARAARSATSLQSMEDEMVATLDIQPELPHPHRRLDCRFGPASEPFRHFTGAFGHGVDAAPIHEPSYRGRYPGDIRPR